jgi:imidazolonepropionase-like amidohydrolase
VKYADPSATKRRLAAYLYSGITAVRSTGDFLHNSLDLRKEMQSGKYQGADLFTCGPLFTAEGGHPEELIKNFPSSMQTEAKSQFLRQPRSTADARRQVDELKSAGVDCIKSVLERGNPEWGTFNRLDNEIYRAVIEESKKDNRPTATHTGNADDVRIAVDAGTNSVEHGSMTDLIPADTFSEMARKQTAFDPTLSIYEALAAVRTGNLELLSRSLVQQVGPADLLTSTQNTFKHPKDRIDSSHFTHMFEILNRNLVNAYKEGVPLITGSDAGNMLVIHGPTIQRELELWVKAGIPPALALQAATHNAAKVLRADERFGLIQKDYEATLIVVDGDPVQDITATEHINSVYLRGEHIDRSDLFDQFKP